MEICPRVGQIGEAFVKQTKIVWVIMLHGIESTIVSALLTKTSTIDYEKLCDTDFLGLKESNHKQDDYVYKMFKKQLKRDEEGWYETGLVWKKRNLPLGNNKNMSLGRLKRLVRNLK